MTIAKMDKVSIKDKRAEMQPLPALPDKRYFTIGETAKLCAVKPHVLRYWEQEFSMLKPTKRRGSRRYYQHKDVLMIRQIRELLYQQGFTISGARQQLKQNAQPAEPVVQIEQPIEAGMIAEKPVETWLAQVVTDLENLLEQLRAPLMSIGSQDAV